MAEGLDTILPNGILERHVRDQVPERAAMLGGKTASELRDMAFDSVAIGDLLVADREPQLAVALYQRAATLVCLAETTA